MSTTRAIAQSGRAVAVTAVIATVVIAISGLATQSAVQVMADAEGWANHTYAVESALEQLSSALRDVESGERTYLIVGQESLLEPYAAALPRIAPGIARIESLTRDNAAQQARIAAVRSDYGSLLASFERAIALRRSGAPLTQLADFGGEAERLTAGIFQRVTEMMAVEQQLLTVREAKVHHAHIVAAIARTSLLALSLAQIAVLFLVARRAANRISRGERRLAVIFASIGEGVIATDREGRIERMNPVAERLTGWTAADAYARRIEEVFNVVHETTRMQLDSPVHQVLRGERVDAPAGPAALVARDRTEHPIESSVAPIGEATPGGDGVVLVFRDATAQRELARARADSEARFQRIADEMPQIVYVVDEHGTIEYLNRRWIEYTGRTGMLPPREEDSIHPDDRERLAERWVTAHMSESVLNAQIRIRDRHGVYRWFLTRAVPIRDLGGGPLRWYGTATDIDEQIEAREALADAHRRKDEFLVTLSHELRDPLAPIRTAVQLLRAPAVDSGRQRWAADMIERQVQNMALLLDELLDVSRITRGTIVLHEEPTPLRTVVDAAVEVARPLIESRHHVLTVEGLLDITVVLDPLRITQTLRNLLTNAAKYSDPGAQIGVSAGADDDSVWISVRDTGIGLAADEIATVFELFAQAKAAQDRSMGGLGIGLALVKGFVELHGGYVTAASDGPGRGSEFRIVLPRDAQSRLTAPSLLSTG